MADEETLEGWEPRVGEDASLTEVIDRAFDYRGDVTVILKNGAEVVGYLFNRNRDVSQPFVQLFEATGGALRTIRYADIRTIRFTGKDTAAGTSYAAWLRRREAARAATPSTRGA